MASRRNSSAASTSDTVQITTDQTAGESTERGRIQAAGGYVEYGRLSGVLEPSRSIGDSDLKCQGSGLIAVPVITEFDPWTSWGEDDDDWETLTVVMATDGMWDTIRTEEVAGLMQRWAVFGEGAGKVEAGGAAGSRGGRGGKKARRQARAMQLKALRGRKKDKIKGGVDRQSKGLGVERTEFARLLASEAKRRGSRDDITVIVAHYTREKGE